MYYVFLSYVISYIFLFLLLQKILCFQRLRQLALWGLRHFHIIISYFLFPLYTPS